MAKNLSKTGFKVKIEQSYEDVVMRQVGPNWYSESSPMDLVKDFQKNRLSAPKFKNMKVGMRYEGSGWANLENMSKGWIQSIGDGCSTQR